MSDLTKAPEMLGGRVKTLHPAVHGGILARKDLESDAKDMKDRDYVYIDYVVCNLYPFEATVAGIKSGTSNGGVPEAVEQIDIGGVTLLRAAAKNHERVTVLCDPSDYKSVIQSLESSAGEGLSHLRRKLALKAFWHTAAYDRAIAGFFGSNSGDVEQFERELRYGMNPHQKPARVFTTSNDCPGGLPFKVINGSPGYINLLDALNSWPLVQQLDKALQIPAAASFKHVSPAGVAVGLPLSIQERKVFQVEADLELSELACAFARARGGDRMSSFGDFIALSRKCDVQTAKLISKEVSDGVIAPDFEPQAIEILSKKKSGRYCILQIDPEYKPAQLEQRQVFGVWLEQKRNDANICWDEIVQLNPGLGELPKQAKIDIVVALTSLKYTQSNSVCLSWNGMVIGSGAGQQSRIHCTRLASDKADNFRLRFHPDVLGLYFKSGTKRADKSNAIDLFVSGELAKASEIEKQDWMRSFEQEPKLSLLDPETREKWLLSSSQNNSIICPVSSLTIASDAFFPFEDNVHRAGRSGVKYLVAPSGSVRDDRVEKVAKDTYGMTVVRVPWRLFHH